MEIHGEPNHQEVIRQAIHCAMVYSMHGASSQVTRVVDMATTGDIPEGYTHLMFVVIDEVGYIVSRNLQGQYKVEMHDRINNQGENAPPDVP